MRKKIKALVLFSGGLDSLLAVKILEKQEIETAGICFSSNFFGAEKARRIAEANGVKLFVEDFGTDILELVKNPPHGLGRNMNPCIDCHAAMFKRAREFADKNGYDFLASGEVLGQRPFSQNKLALAEVAKTAGEELLRPLSAKLLSETEMEKQGWVDREQLLDLQGRQRNRQLELVKTLGIKKFEAPAGGCLLTDPAFGKRLERALNEFSKITEKDVELLKYGRIYWLKLRKKKSPILVVIGRNKEDNENLKRLFFGGDFLLKPKNIMGPDVLIRAFKDELNSDNEIIRVTVPEDKPKGLDGKVFNNEIEMFEEIGILGGWYIKKARKETVEFLIEK